MASNDPSPPAGRGPGFSPTRWSLVQLAGDWRAGSQARRAMEELLRAYWFPLYAYLRSRGSPPEDAEDLIQGFFARMLEKDSLSVANPDRGRFRSFLLASLQHFMANEYDKSQAQKRGGANKPIALDALDAEARYALEPADQMTPERIFEQRWALEVLDQVLQRLRAHYQNEGQGPLFEALKSSLMGMAAPSSYRTIAQNLGITEGAVGVAAHRLRRRYREMLREEIAQTLASPELIDEEIRYLLGCL